MKRAIETDKNYRHFCDGAPAGAIGAGHASVVDRFGPNSVIAAAATVAGDTHRRRIIAPPCTTPSTHWPVCSIDDSYRPIARLCLLPVTIATFTSVVAPRHSHHHACPSLLMCWHSSWHAPLKRPDPVDKSLIEVIMTSTPVCRVNVCVTTGTPAVRIDYSRSAGSWYLTTEFSPKQKGQR